MIILQILFILGLIVGWLKGEEELKNSKKIYKDKPLWRYWIG